MKDFVQRRLLVWMMIVGFVLIGKGLSAQAASEEPARINQIEVSTLGEVNIQLDHDIRMDQVEVAFLKKSIQLTLNGVEVQPPKRVPVKGQELDRVFAYQFAPNKVRIRLFVNKNPMLYKPQFEMQLIGKTLSMSVPTLSPLGIPDISDEETSSEEEEVQAIAAPKEKNSKLEKKPEVAPRAEEDLKAASAPIDQRIEKEKTSSLTGAKPLPSFFHVFLKLGAVTLLLLSFAIALKKIKTMKAQKGILGVIGKWASQGNQNQMFQVVSVHRLDAKKSIAAVKVGGRLLVLGISDNAINLISQFNDEEDFNDAAASAAFESVLTGEQIRPSGQTANTVYPSMGGGQYFRKTAGSQVAPRISPAEFEKSVNERSMEGPSFAQASMVPDVRNRIKNKLEGLKPL